jgi:hypothetical protein
MKTRVVSAWDSAVAVSRRAARLQAAILALCRTRREQALRNAQKYRPNISADPAAPRAPLALCIPAGHGNVQLGAWWEAGGAAPPYTSRPLARPQGPFRWFRLQ